MQDPYVTLGVKRGAGADEIRHAYRVLAARAHPDLQPPKRKAWAHAEMLRLNAARSALLTQRPSLIPHPVVRRPTPWPFSFGFGLCFVISILLPFVAYLPGAGARLLQIVTSLAAAALSLGVVAYAPLIVSVGLAIVVVHSWRSRA